MQNKIYHKKDIVSFRSTKEVFGGLSNMASGYTLFVNGVLILSSEALYQACRFPNHPEIQHKIIQQKSPMTAKMISRKYKHLTRSDWEAIKIDVMQWCLEIKLSQNWELFSKVLLSTGNRPIVEFSKKDKIWGAIDTGNGQLEGANALGELLVKLRDKYVKTNQRFECVEPLTIPNFLLYDNKIDWVCDGLNDIFDLDSEDIHEHLVAA